jgi:hypothetical protein
MFLVKFFCHSTVEQNGKFIEVKVCSFSGFYFLDRPISENNNNIFIILSTVNVNATKNKV